MPRTPRRSATSSSSTASAPRSARPAKGMYAETRADDLVIRCIRELLRRNPQLPPERVDEVAIAATTQIGDQGLTIGRTAALLAGLPKTRARLLDRPHVRGRDDRGDHRRRRHRLRRLRRRDRRRRRAHGPPPDGRGRRPEPAHPGREAGRPVGAGHGLDRGEPARPLPAHHQGARRRLRRRQPGEDRQGRTPTARSSPTWCPSPPASRESGWGLATVDEPPRPAPRWRSSPRSRRRSARTAGSPPATPPASTTAPPPASLAAEEVADELGPAGEDAAGRLRLRRRRARGHGRRPDPVDREGAAPWPA